MLAAHISVDVKYLWATIRASPVERNVRLLLFFRQTKSVSAVVL
jgi:hypothetical protein